MSEETDQAWQQLSQQILTDIKALTMHERKRKRIGGIGRKAPGPSKEALDLWLSFLYPLQKPWMLVSPASFPKSKSVKMRGSGYRFPRLPLVRPLSARV